MPLNRKGIVILALIITVACSAFFCGWQYQASTRPATTQVDTVFQLGAFNTFSTGKYSGVMPYSELEQYGNFGIGTFDGLDGEMIALDGVFYQIPSNGTPQIAESTQTSPHATVTYFNPDLTYSISDLNYTGLQHYLDSKLSATQDAIYAIKIVGNFSFIQARSPMVQSEPYPDLNEALKTQGIFNFSDVAATAVGYWFPSSMNGVAPAGYHLHIITQDRTAGGHLLECNITSATVEVDVAKSYYLKLP